jgi:hypothetical protein
LFLNEGLLFLALKSQEGVSRLFVLPCTV